MFAKTQVKKGGADPLFQALGEAAGRYPKWNFHKYLIGRDGGLVENYPSRIEPQSSEIVDAVEALL
jgi:glutathione peroxidase